MKRLLALLLTLMALGAPAARAQSLARSLHYQRRPGPRRALAHDRRPAGRILDLHDRPAGIYTLRLAAAGGPVVQRLVVPQPASTAFLLKQLLTFFPFPF